MFSDVCGCCLILPKIVAAYASDNAGGEKSVTLRAKKLRIFCLRRFDRRCMHCPKNRIKNLGKNFANVSFDLFRRVFATSGNVFVSEIW